MEEPFNQEDRNTLRRNRDGQKNVIFVVKIRIVSMQFKENQSQKYHNRKKKWKNKIRKV